MALATITFVIGVGLVVLTFWQAYQVAGLGSIVATRGIRLFEACLGAPLDHGPKA